jgi:hypothetical protein
MKAPRVHCNLCGKSIRSGFQNQWKHLVNRHPGEFLGKIIPMMLNPEVARFAGKRLADSLLRRP